MNGTTTTNHSDELPRVEVFLSRPAYPLGGSLVGTVLIRPSIQQQQQQQLPQDHQPAVPLRSLLSSVVVYVAGFCRIDPRWHNVSEYTNIYGKVHPFLQLLYTQRQFEPELLTTTTTQEGGGGGADETVCFWATNGVELLDLNERTEGKWEVVPDDSNSNTNSGIEEMLAFTFRVDIPLDVPHSIHAATCRYYYSADVLIKTASKQRIIKTPFLVWANPHSSLAKSSSSSRSKPEHQKNRIISGRVKFATLEGMAHSIGLPCHLSATEIHRPRGQMTVAMHTRSRSDVQTLRVSNAAGRPVCVMTVVGAARLTPGSRVHLHWDFPETISSSKDWIPCHQVSACLMGEELAVYEDGTTTRTQSFVFDTCHEWVDPGVTHRVSKTLLLSMDAPCNLYTDVMELSIQCRVEITVKENNGDYNNLRIELPCQVVHSFGREEEDIFEQEENQIPLAELLGQEQDTKESFITNDIVPDLKILALQMEERLRDTTTTKKGLS
jgi:hypothetical protein